MGPIIRLVSLVLVLGTWWAMSGRSVDQTDLPQVVASSETSFTR